MQLAFEPALRQGIFEGMKYVGEQIASTLQVVCRYTSMFLKNDLKHLIEKRIRPFVNDYIKLKGKVLADKLWQLLQNVMQQTGITESLQLTLATVKGTAGLCVALIEMPNALVAYVGCF